MKRLITILLALTVFSSLIMENIVFFEEIEVVEWFDGDLDGENEEEKLKVEDKLFVEYFLDRKTNRFFGSKQLEIWYITSISDLYSEILTPPPELV